MRSEVLDRAVRARIAANREEIANSLRMAAEGRPRAAETERERLVGRIMAERRCGRAEAEAVANRLSAKRRGREVVQGDTADFVWTHFFAQGGRAARSVARVVTPSGFGTGFMVSPLLFVTNQHVIESARHAAETRIEFGFDRLENGSVATPAVFELDPARFFHASPDSELDFALVAVGRRAGGPGVELAQFGWCALSQARDKHSLGEFANIIQHPSGEAKQVVLRENRLVARTAAMLHYAADTEPGSSGSPVFNAQWQVIALHHWGGPSVRGMKDEDGKRVPVHVNEGVRASAIVGHLEEAVRNGSIPAAQARLLAEERARASGPAPEMRPDAPGVGSAAEFRNEGNRAVWRIPLEISVQLPSLARDASSLTHEPAAGQAGGPGAGGADRTTAGAEKLAPDPDYGSRPGYRADFMSGHIVAMPKLSSAMAKQAARNREAEPGEDPHELKYRHFSLVMNARRRLAFFTACNIDGKTAKDVDRKTGAVTPARVGSEAMEAAEASEQWFLDPRIGEDQQTPQALYDRQATVLEDGRAAGGQAHLNRMFQRGHLVRRKDPSWGSNADARAADADTFHFTNCAPQTGFFNMGTAPRSLAGSGGGNLWRALEDHVLDNAVREARRISVFTGPVFATSDPKWRSDVVAGFRVPREFWKIVVWSDRGRLRSLAMIASQKAVMGKKLPGTKEELDQLDKVEDFVATVAKIEKLTGLDFGKAVRDGDISAGGSEAMRRVSDFAEVFSAGGRRSKRRAAR